MNSMTRLLLFIFLGTLVSFGPFITDMYLVSLPQMMSYFQVEKPTIQMTLTFSMLGLALGQIIFGYLGDRYGRKIPLMTGLFLFTLFTLFSLTSKNINLFLLCRFIQGLAGAGCIVLGRSIIPDLFQKDVMVKAISVTTLIYTINRIISPIIGGFAFQLSGWKGIFICLFIIGLLLLIASFFIPETHPQTLKKETSLMVSLKKLIRNKTFMCFLTAFTFILTIQFAYIASCSFIFQKHYNISPMLFSFIFAFNAAVFGVGAFIPATNGNIYIYEILLIVFRFLTGFCFTVFMSKALESCRETAGLGAAFLGTFYFLFGSIVTPLVGYGNILYSSAIIMFFFAILNYSVIHMYFKKKA